MIEPVSVKIYVFYYKNGTVLINDHVYQPIMAGNALFKGSKTFTGDDTGENISYQNPVYSELTGIYWVWKNTKQDITGCCHYRRFFTALPEPFLYKLKRFLYYPIGLHKKRFGVIYTGNKSLFAPRILNQHEIITLLQKFDAILPHARKLNDTVENHYRKFHNQNDLKIIESILSDRFPDFLDAFHIFLRGKRIYANNMFILKNEHFQEFMEWWFGVLSEFKKRIDINQYTGYQQRILGFIAERSLNVWFIRKQLKCIELPVIYFKKLKYEQVMDTD